MGGGEAKLQNYISKNIPVQVTLKVAWFLATCSVVRESQNNNKPKWKNPIPWKNHKLGFEIQKTRINM